MDPLANERFVHYGCTQRAFAVRFGDTAAPQDLHAGRLEITGRDVVEQSEMAILRMVRLVQVQPDVTPSEEPEPREAGRAHAGERIQALIQCPVLGRPPRLLFGRIHLAKPGRRLGIADVHEHDVAGVKTGVYCRDAQHRP